MNFFPGKNNGYTTNNARKRKIAHLNAYTREDDGYERGYVRGYIDGRYLGHNEDTEYERQRKIIKSNYDRDYAIVFLLGSGLSSELLDGLPESLITQFKPMKCYLCSSEFTSKFTAEKHYIGKNHAKKTLRWLTNDAEMRNTTVPRKLMEILKSQQRLVSAHLHCEICNVTLESRAAAESHIIGKKHKGFLTGTIPRYPNIDKATLYRQHQQLVMMIDEARKTAAPVEPVDISILCAVCDLNVLKSKMDIHKLSTEHIEKEKASEALLLEKKKEEQSLSLTCEICNITVGQPHQIVEHKNGKKHLSKEKKYILNICNSKCEEVANDPFKDDTIEKK